MEQNFTQTQQVVDAISHQFKIVQQNDKTLYDETTNHLHIINTHVIPTAQKVRDIADQLPQL